MPSKTESLALHIMRALYDATAGRPLQWRSLAGISDVAETREAVDRSDRAWRVRAVQRVENALPLDVSLARRPAVA